MGRSSRLHLAAQRLDVDGVKRLLALGADPFALDSQGKTPAESMAVNPSLSVYEMADARAILDMLAAAEATSRKR